VRRRRDPRATRLADRSKKSGSHLARGGPFIILVRVGTPTLGLGWVSKGAGRSEAGVLTCAMAFSSEDERFMRLALEEAEGALARWEVPVGCVVVRDGRLVARGSNRTNELRNVRPPKARKPSHPSLRSASPVHQEAGRGVYRCTMRKQSGDGVSGQGGGCGECAQVHYVQTALGPALATPITTDLGRNGLGTRCPNSNPTSLGRDSHPHRVTGHEARRVRGSRCPSRRPRQ